MADYKNDIDKYLKGELTPAEMHALEKKALNDPFLADALEGLQPLQSEDLVADLNQLQHSLHKRIQKKNAGSWLWIGRIAAGLVLLAVATYLIVTISNRSGEKASDNLALNKQKEVTPAPPVKDLPSPTPDSTALHSSDASSSKPLGREELKKEKSIAPEQPSDARSRADESLAEIRSEKPLVNEADKGEEEQTPVETERIQAGDKLALAESEEIQPSSTREESKGKKDEPLEDDLSNAARKKSLAGAPAQAPSVSNNVTRRIVRGKVTFSDDGTGLPGVNVLIQGTNEGTVTDVQGNYQIPVNEAEPTLLFSFIGFTNKEAKADKDEVNVQLDADVSELSEVVVVGYGSKDIEFLPSTPTVMELATPEGGRKVFKQYLEKNVKYPEQALKNRVEGKVTIQFTIGTSGQLSDFRVIRGIGYGCDEEVIRLIKEGPKWYPTKKNEAPIRDRVRVRMRFALPKK